MNFTLLVNFAGIALIFITVWFFFMKRDAEAVDAGKEIAIKVEGGYTPSVIKVHKGQEVNLLFFRKDPSDCLEEIVIPDFKIREHLVLGKTTRLTFTPDKIGEFVMSCGMNMFHGKIKVE